MFFFAFGFQLSAVSRFLASYIPAVQSLLFKKIPEKKSPFQQRFTIFARF